jgi:aminoglycoside phosphotransferase family enzyme
VRRASTSASRPTCYLGVATVTDPEGEPCEWLVVKPRMPDDRRLSTLVTSGVDVKPHLRRLARDIATFHATARSNSEITDSGSPPARPVVGECGGAPSPRP